MQKFRVKISISEGQLFHGWIDRSETRIIAYESPFIESWWSTSLTHSWGFWNASSLIIPGICNFVVKLLRLINISFRKGSILFHLELFIWRWSYEILLAYRNYPNLNYWSLCWEFGYASWSSSNISWVSFKDVWFYDFYWSEFLFELVLYCFI